MRNLAEKWPAFPDWESTSIQGPGFSIRSVTGLNQMEVSGDLQAWNRRTGLSGPGVGAFSTATGDPYAVRLARDRILAVSAKPFDLAPGWHDNELAVTELSAALHVFEIDGPSLHRIVSRAVAVDPDNAGPSAVVTFAGTSAIAYYHEDKQTLRVHVDRGFASYLWSWLEDASRAC
jgi:heterotetrameric sarcosine oxidase gamma subunit